MTSKTKLIIGAIGFMCVFLIAAISSFQKKDDLLPIELQAVQTDVGWGYEIKVDGSLFIRQVDIPAIRGTRPFATKQDALLVGRHAVNKLKMGKLPAITEAELKEWDIVNTSKP